MINFSDSIVEETELNQLLAHALDKNVHNVADFPYEPHEALELIQQSGIKVHAPDTFIDYVQKNPEQYSEIALLGIYTDSKHGKSSIYLLEKLLKDLGTTVHGYNSTITRFKDQPNYKDIFGELSPIGTNAYTAYEYGNKWFNQTQIKSIFCLPPSIKADRYTFTYRPVTCYETQVLLWFIENKYPLNVELIAGMPINQCDLLRKYNFPYIDLDA